MTIHWVPQGAAAVSAVAIGFLWYGVLFPKTWAEVSGVTIEKIKNGLHPAIIYGLALVLAFMLSMGLYRHIIDIHAAFKSTTNHPFWHGAGHAFQNGFIYGGITTLVTNALFDRKSWKYILINLGYWIITFGVMGGLIGLLA